MKMNIGKVFVEIDLPDGKYDGHCSGAMVLFAIGKRECHAFLETPIKAINEHCTVTAKNKKVSVEFK